MLIKKLNIWFANWKKKRAIKNSWNSVPKYLQGDKSKHRIHSTKYEDLCK